MARSDSGWHVDSYPTLVHPGEILREEMMAYYKLTPGKLAKMMKCDRQRIELLVREKRGIGPDTAHRLSRVFGTSAHFWMNLQTNYDLGVIAHKTDYDKEGIVPL